MEQIIQKLTKNDTFENELVQAYQKQLADPYAPFVPYSQFFDNFVTAINRHYNQHFEATMDVFERFDVVVTPLIYDILQKKTLQAVQGIDSGFGTKAYIAACQSLQQASQEEFGIRTCFVQKETVLAHAFHETVRHLKQLVFDQSLWKKCQRINAAIQEIQDSVQLQTEELLTGEDIADILTFVAMRARVQGLPEMLQVLSENLPHQVKSGRTGFNLMSLQLAVCGLCQFTSGDLKSNSKVADSPIKSKRFLLPGGNDIYSNLICQPGETADRPFVEVGRYTLHGYHVLVLMDYVFSEDVCLKAVCFKGLDSDRDAVAECTVVALNPEFPTARALKIDNQMSGRRIVQFQETSENGCSLLIIKQLEHFVSQNVVLVSGKSAYSAEELAKLAVLQAYGCLEHQRLVDCDWLFCKQAKTVDVCKTDEDNRIARLIHADNLEQAVRTFASAYRHEFSMFRINQSYYSEMAATLRFIQHMLAMEALGDDVIANIQQISKIDTGIILRSYSFRKICKISENLPCRQIMKFVHAQGIDIKQLFPPAKYPLFCSLISDKPHFGLLYPEKLENLPETLTPLALQQCVNLVAFYTRCFVLLSKQRFVDLFTDISFQIFSQAVQAFQKQNGIEPSGVFDLLTCDAICRLIEIRFLEGKIGQKGVQLKEFDVFI